MKTIENISPVFEKLLEKGLEISVDSASLTLYGAELSLFYLEDTVFLVCKIKNTYTNKNQVKLFEIKKAESSFLLTAVNQVIDDLDRFGEDEKKKDSIAVYRYVITFCKKIIFDCKEFESALAKLL